LRETPESRVCPKREGVLRPRIPDAVSIAFATAYRIDFRLNWNCRHRANANKLLPWTPSARHLACVAKIVTPHTLVPWEGDR